MSSAVSNAASPAVNGQAPKSPAPLAGGHTYQMPAASWPDSSQEQDRLHQLAAGVAHDYNNLLTSMLCGIQIALEELAPSHRSRRPLEAASSAVERAAELTQQLMAYAGIAPVIVSRLDVAALVWKAAAAFRASLAAPVQMKVDIGANLPPVAADPNQIGQLVHALLTNAAEALGGREGTITIRLLPGLTGGALAPGGKFVQLEVTDTGCGMDDWTRRRIFEPFFSTKFLGRGMGLAGAAGIVRLHGGTMEVRSAPGAGATFRVCLPAAPEPNSGDRRVSGKDSDCGR